MAKNLKKNEAYEIGYRNGESSGYADWFIALVDTLPIEVDGHSPSAVAEYIEKLQDQIEAVNAGRL